MLKVSIVGAALCFAFQPAMAAPLGTPVIRIADPNSLKRAIQFAPPNPKLHGLPGGEIYWRVNIDLPPHTAVERIGMRGYDPVYLQLTDGGCFKIDLQSYIRRLTKLQIDQIDCRAFDSNAEPSPTPTQHGLRFVGRAWDLCAWEDLRSRKTILVPSGHADAAPLLTTSMHTLGVGAMGAPDAPMTEVTLAGYVGRQLTLATVMLYYP
jgi:hypothetical protein